MCSKANFVVQQGNVFVAMAMSGVLLSDCAGGGSPTGSAANGSPSVSMPSSYTLGGSIAACLAEITYVEDLKTTVYSEEV